MNPTAGSFNIDPRLQRLFATFAVETPSLDSLMTIFGCFLHGHLKKFNSGKTPGAASCPDRATGSSCMQAGKQSNCKPTRRLSASPPNVRCLPAPPAEVQELLTKILQAALALHERVCATFRKTAVNHHYDFSGERYCGAGSGVSCPDALLAPSCCRRCRLADNHFPCLLNVCSAPAAAGVPGPAEFHPRALQRRPHQAHPPVAARERPHL